MNLQAFKIWHCSVRQDWLFFLRGRPMWKYWRFECGHGKYALRRFLKGGDKYWTRREAFRAMLDQWFLEFYHLYPAPLTYVLIVQFCGFHLSMEVELREADKVVIDSRTGADPGARAYASIEDAIQFGR